METATNRNAIIVAVKADKDDIVTYQGNLKDYYPGKKNQYVKDYSDGKVTYTEDEKKAMRFTDDAIGTNCMRQIVKDGYTHVLVWEYDVYGSLRCQSIHFPNEYWGINKFLQPLMLTHSVMEFEENPY